MAKKENNVDLLDRILDLKARDIPNKQIIDTLRKEGYANTDILEAMNQADIKSAVDEPGADEILDEVPKTSFAPPKPSGMSVSDIRDVAETIIEDKWKTVQKDLDELQDWKKDINGALSEVQGRVDAIDAGVVSLRKSILEQVKSYSEGLEDVSAEIKAMDQVFRKILPTLSSDVKELSAIVGKMKKK